jgi:hypothetical protein
MSAMTLAPAPPDPWYLSSWFLTIVGTGGGCLAGLQLHPIELRWNTGRDSDRGLPRLAPVKRANRILNRLRRLSAPFGARVLIRHGVGHVTPA